MKPRDTRRVAALAYDGLGTFEFGIVTEVFGLPRPELGVDWYEFEVCSLERGPIRATGGILLQARRGLRSLRQAGTIVIPGWHADRQPPEPLLRALRSAHAAGSRLVSICSGVFVLAATGLLDRRRPTTHWRFMERFDFRYPSIKGRPHRLYVAQ